MSQRLGLCMNMDKTKFMSNVHVSPTPVILGGSALEIVDDYVCLGQTVQQVNPISRKRSIDEFNSVGLRLGNNAAPS